MPARTNTHRSRSLTNYLFWTLVLQGISFILIGILIIVYPATLFILAATGFIWSGLTTLLLAWRVRSFWGFMHHEND